MTADVKPEVDTTETSIENFQDDGGDGKKSSPDDRADMFRMGKVQELRRNFRFLSIFGFSMILMATWEAALSLAVVSLVNGGPAGLVWITFICWIGFIFVNVSMAEMGSMAPTTGGQYHWISEFAPKSHQKFMSYLMGWICVLGWQTLCASTAFVAGTMIQGLLVLNYPDSYTPARWHGTLLTIAVATFSVFFNTLLCRKLPLIEGIVLVIHIFGFIGVLTPLWVLSPKANASQVFTEFADGGGWGSVGLSTLVGMVSGIMPLLGADAAVHMSEELRDAGKTLPRSMIASTLINGFLGWIAVITFGFCMGGELEDLLATSSGFPFLQVFLNATGSTGATTAMAMPILLINIFSNLSVVATASRQLYAFARDQGLPYGTFFAKINNEVPFHAICTTLVVSILLSLINLGSTVALNSIMSLATQATIASYFTSIGYMIWRRVTNQPLLPSKFTLGRWGLFFNVMACIFLLFAFIFSCFPSVPTPTVESFNWNIPIFGFILIFSLVYFFVHGRHHYDGPVTYVRQIQ